MLGCSRGVPGTVGETKIKVTLPKLKTSLLSDWFVTHELVMSHVIMCMRAECAMTGYLILRPLCAQRLLREPYTII
jgi:hypothetical protein